MDILHLYKDILELLPTGHIQNLMEVAYRYVKMPILTTDITYTLLGTYPKQDTEDKYWDDLCHQKKYGEETVFELYEDKIMQSADQHHDPYLVDWGRAASDNPKLVGPIQVDGHTEGFVCLLCGKNGCSQEILEAMKIIQQACEVIFRSQQPRINLLNVHQKAFAGELLSGKILTRGQLEKWHRNTGFYPQGDYLVFVVQTQPGEEGTVLTSLYRQIEKLFPEQLSYSQGQMLYVLRYHVQENEQESAKREIFRKLLSRFHYQCGTSVLFQDLLHTPDYIRQAQDALRLGRQNGKEDQVFSYQKYALLAILQSGTEELPPVNFLHPAIQILNQYDRQHHTEFLLTLETYIKHLGHPGPVVEELHIHRNSLPYRIGKIEQITGCSLSDFETFLHLAVNFYIRKQEEKE